MDAAIGYVMIGSLPQALTYGSQADIAAWVAVNIEIDATTAIYQVKSGDDLQRAVTDHAYFRALLGG